MSDCDPTYIRRSDPTDADKDEFHIFRNFEQAARWVWSQEKDWPEGYTLDNLMRELGRDWVIEIGDFFYTLGQEPTVRDHREEP